MSRLDHRKVSLRQRAAQSLREEQADERRTGRLERQLEKHLDGRQAWRTGYEISRDEELRLIAEFRARRRRQH